MTHNKKKKRKLTRKYMDPQQVCGDVTELYITAIFGIYPLVIGMGDYGYHNLVKTKAFFWLGITSFWFACLSCYLVWCKIKGLHVILHYKKINYYIIGFLIINLLSTCNSKYVRESMIMLRSSNTNSLIFIASYAVAYMGVSFFGEIKPVQIRALGISTLLSDILTITQLKGYNILGMYPQGLNYYNKYKEYTGAYLGTLGNVDVLSAFLCFSIPVLCVYAIRSKTKYDKLLIIPSILSLYILIKSEVESGKIGILGCILISMPVLIQNMKTAKKAGIVSIVILVFLLILVYVSPIKKGLLYEAHSILHGNLDPSFGHDRIGIWQQVIHSIIKEPFLGNGPGSAAWLIDFKTVNEKWNRIVSVRNAHNTYLGYLMDIGLFGLTFYIIIIVKSCKTWIKNRNIDLITSLGTGLTCYLIQDFFNINIVSVAPFLWICMGLLT